MPLKPLQWGFFFSTIMATQREIDRIKDTIKDIQQESGWSLRALSSNIGVNHSYLSQFLNDRLDHVSPNLISTLNQFIASYAQKHRSQELSKRDEKRLMEILEIMEYADNKLAIITALNYGGQSTAVDGQRGPGEPEDTASAVSEL